MPAAARLTDLHVCPVLAPAPLDGQVSLPPSAPAPPQPHIGGPLTGPGVPTVLIGGLPAAALGDQAVCAGPPDLIVSGSRSVMVGGRPAARVGDRTAHGGQVTQGCATVMIGG